MPDLAATMRSSPAPFDALAEAYDAQFTETLIGRAQRATVLGEFKGAFLPGTRVLEINCGTGVDAVYLGHQGVQVLACDASPAMIRVARRRLDTAALRATVEFRCLATENLGKLIGEAPFDGVLSNFAGLNCVEDLHGVARDLARLLRPGARALLCLFGRFCAWEVLWYLGRGQAGQAFRRFQSGAQIARLGKEASVEVRYPSARRVRQIFAPQFRLRGWKGVGVAVPPTYAEGLARRFPRLLGGLELADKKLLARLPGARALGDHVLLEFERV